MTAADEPSPNLPATTKTPASAQAVAPLPGLRPSIDVANVGHDAARQDGEEVVCLYDRQDPSSGQVVITRAGLLLASLLDGTRTAVAVRAAFALRAGSSPGLDEISAFAERLDQAGLLDSPRYREAQRRSVEAFRAGPTRPAAHAGGAYPGEAGELRRFLDERYTMPGGPGARPGAVSSPSRRGLIAPHIDLHRGGHSYAWGYRALAEAEPADLYVLLGTCHQPMRRPFAATALPYDTPFGPVTADHDFLDRLQRRAPYDLLEDEFSHRREHALEFQAVYLRYLGHTGEGHTGEGHTGKGQTGERDEAGAPDGSGGPARVVSILCVPPSRIRSGGTPRDDQATEEVIQAIAETVAESEAKDGRRVCLIAGADFAHVGPQFGDPAPVDARLAEHVRAGDLAMLEQCTAGDADGFYHQVVRERPGPGMAGDSMAVGGPRRICGLAPIYALLRLVGRRHGQVLHYDQWIDRGGAGSVTFGCVLYD